MAARLFGDFDPAEHARDFGDPLFVRQPLNLSKSPSFFNLLVYDEVDIRERSDLRQMSNADDLMARCDLLEFFADDLCNSSTHTAVNLIKEQRGDHSRREHE